MPYFLVALLVVATVFLIVGIVGRDVSAGSGTFMLKIEGRVGPFPRAVFLIFSVINYGVALILFLVLVGAANPPQPSPGNSPTKVALTSPARSLPPGPGQVTIQISDSLYGNEADEVVTVNVDGAAAVSLTADSNNRAVKQDVTLSEGKHAYDISVQGDTTDGSSYDYAGQGTILAEQDNSYSVVLYPNTGVAGLQPG